MMLPIPGTSDVEHLKENMGASAVKRSQAEWSEIDRAAAKA